MDPYATHLCALVGAVARTTGPVLELGAGEYSTPILHELCEASGRVLWSVDHEADWLGVFRARFETDTHKFVHVADTRGTWIDWRIAWDVVLVDHRPAWIRRDAIEECLVRPYGPTYVVAHDTEPAQRHLYDMDRVLSMFRYRREFFDDSPAMPWTTVVSNRLPIWKAPGGQA